MEVLKSCPFCGGEAKFIDDHQIECQQCKALLWNFPNELTKKWNHRKKQAIYLFPCPNCGLRKFMPIVTPREKLFAIACFNCGLQTEGKPTLKEAYAAWNLRVPSPNDQASYDEVMKTLSKKS